MGRLTITICVIGALIAPAGSSATTIDRRPGLPPYQVWADTALVPTAPGRVVVRNEPCPMPGAEGREIGACYDPASRTIYMAGPNAANRAQFLHELGHDFEATVLTDAHRAGFLKIMRYRTSSWAAHAPDSDESAQERFATAYSVCARRREISRIGHLYGPGHGYGYRPTASQHRRVCALITRAPSAAANHDGVAR